MLLILVSICCVFLNGINAFWSSNGSSAKVRSTIFTSPITKVQSTISKQNTSYASTPVRLVGGSHYWEGRIEVYHGGQWGTICDDHFGRQDAEVICSMLGYGRYGSITAYGQARFGEGSGSIMLDDLDCTGYENDIAQCKSTGWRIHNCAHTEDAGVACNPGTSTLRYGSSKLRYGNFTYRYGSSTDRYGSTTYRYGSTTYRYGSTTLWYVTVGRYGHIPIRLNAGNRGSLMLYYNGRWGYVCYSSHHHAYQFNAVCRYLGYSSAYSISQQYESQPALVTDFRCPGYSYSKGVDDCIGHNLGSNTYCRNKLYITCDSLTTEESVTKPFSTEETSVSYTNVRLVGGRYNWEGRVEIYHNGSWGTICDDDFDTNDAQVICAMLGYNISGSVAAYGNAYFGAGNGSILLDDLGCHGYESDILQCKSRGWYSNNCGHSEDASVSCRYLKSGRLNSTVKTTLRPTTSTRYFHRTTNPSQHFLGTTTAGLLGRYYAGHLSFRLTNGNSGFLQIYYNGQWGYVCYNSNQYSNQFHSACRYLGYSSAYNVYGRYDGSHAIVTDFHCPSSYYYSNYSSNGIDDCTGYRLGLTNYCSDKLFIVCDLDVSTVGYEVTTTDVLGSHGRIPINLTYGSHGFLQIYYNGSWGYVCYNSSHSTYQFNSVCRYLGYSSAYKVYGRYDSSHTALLTDLQCPRSYYHNYSSNGIDDCTGDRFGYSTYCNDKLYIECGGSTVQYFLRNVTATPYFHRTTTPVQYFLRTTTAGVLGRYGHLSFRLTNDSRGFLQIYYNGQWGDVCYNSNQYSSQFHSACRYLGYSSAYSVYGRYDSSHTAIVTDFHCPISYYYYSSNGIDNCTGSRLGYTNYCYDKLYIECDIDASTVGYEVTTADVLGSHGHIPLRLTYDGRGYLQIYYNGRWGYVCHNSSHSTYQFNSVCRYLGYSSAYKVYGRYDSVHTALVTDLQCPGSYYYYSSSNGIDNCTGDRLGYTTYCNDKLYIECDSVTTEETATVPFKTGCQSVTSSPADVIFVVDESGSVGSDNFDRTRASIVDTIRHLDIRNDFIRIGVMTFDDTSRTVFNLNTYPGDPNRMVNRVMSMPYSAGGTDIADALSHACINMFTSVNGDRSNATNYLVLLTDGQAQAQQEADRCKSGGTKIISVGIGDSIDEQVLRNLAYNYDYYLSTNYSDIAGFLPKLVTTAVNCGGLESTNAKHITVNCQHSSWFVKIHLPPLEQQYSDFKETDIYLGSHSCTGTRSGDYLIFNEDYTTCGTNKIASANGVIYTNTLVYAVHDPNQPYIVHEYRFRVSVECDMSKQESGENNINNIHGNLEQQTISGVGHFVVQLKFFSDSNFQHEFNGFPPSYMVGQNVYVKATTPIHDYNVKMRLSNCYTKPSKSASDSYIYYLIRNGCPAEPNAFITTKSTHETRFHFQDFEYAFHPEAMYVHCNATFCHTNDYSSDCEPRCSNRKRVGSIDQDDEPIEGVGPIGYAEDEATVLFRKGPEALNAGMKPEVENKGNKPLYVVGVVVVAAAMVAILVVTSIYFRSKRRQNGQSKIV